MAHILSDFLHWESQRRLMTMFGILALCAIPWYKGKYATKHD